MKRKQIYLTDHLDKQLSELAASKGVPQAEVIREGLELYLKSFEDKDQEWDELIHQMKKSTLHDLKWSRDELYEDRYRRNSDYEQ
ncbi:CopG family transcriptional regulator [Sporolactobacillus laevolacticus]|jgi:predicted DNA-binding protein|uniref:Predicted DNA-binding protein ribbon-helix-helix domain-containing protein n=1 Tax=Sporolactobacillus laevolacticus DSM 442 TaxID=1395513 RepID=V6IZ02_9BACL|nr:CopG family transcriptional regulator [Sporolactobacillus laevolacticus]EST12748.1 hypothetical protein P343_05580 [Sporolactobacillus laevolacticus DSM 442]MDF2911034.1 Ribbon-helix-helix domain [Sporolactobacillus laevolacticus]MDN3954667.1 CopG family transcriptional regulator [Sporolactobacillus laevolacticus]